jgi:2-polyprenyl-3-methyl-5-hydroxy-6-metoxy-1,4-benzoquinol methylase
MSVCTVCQSASARAAFEANGYPLSRCSRCDHLFVQHEFDPSVLERAYDESYYVSKAGSTSDGYDDYLRDAERRMAGFRERLRQIERHTRTRGRLLDYGCAVGLFVKVAAESGWEAIGYERSEWAVQYGRGNLHVDIVLANGGDVPEFEKRFDVVTMWDVLEHLEHPRTAIASVAKWLKPGGLLALNTVNSSSLGARLAGDHWRHVAPPHHLQYFSRGSLKRLLADAGFHVLALQNRGVLFTADRRRPSAHGLMALAESLGTHWRAARLASLLNLGDEIEVVAVLRRGIGAVPDEQGRTSSGSA